MTIPESQTTKASDFSDDPFKNYRYEDVFNIEDPFAEDEVAAKGKYKISLILYSFKNSTLKGTKK